MSTVLGVDITGEYIRIAFEGEKDQVSIVKHRLTFLQIQRDLMSEVLLKKYKSNYIRIGDDFYITGDEAVQLSVIFSKPLFRPIHNGRLHNGDLIAAVLHKLLEVAKVKDIERIVYTVPSSPIDGSFDPAFRQLWLNNLLHGFCKDCRAVYSSQAISMNELIETDLTGIVVDVGEESVNVACSYLSIPALTFSLPYGASWIDTMVAKAVGILPQLANRYRAATEQDLPADSAMAVTHYKGELVSRIVQDLFGYLRSNPNLPHYDKPVEVHLVGEALHTIAVNDLQKSLVSGFEGLGLKLSRVRVGEADSAPSSAVIGALLFAGGDDPVEIAEREVYQALPSDN